MNEANFGANPLPGQTANTANQAQNTGLVTQGSSLPTANPTTTPTTVAAPPPSQTQDASQINSQISGGSTGIIFPQAPSGPTQGASNNTGIPNPIPTAADIISQGTQQTPAEATNQGLLSRLAAMIGSNQGQTALTNQSEQAAGVPELSKTVNDLSTQLEGLNNQSLDLQNQSQYTVPNVNTLKLNGTDATGGGLAGMNANDQRNLQIQQGALASRALTLKSAIYAAQGNLTLAKDAADKAATAQFENQQNQIDYMNALIKANEPSMTKQEKAQADLVTQNLQDRQTKVNLQIENYKTGQAAIADAIKNNPNNPQAQAAAKQATQLDPNDPQYLQKVQSLVSQYGSDLAKRALDMQLTKAQIGNAASSKQDSLEQQFRTTLEKEFSARSGSLGLQSQKVDQAIHLRSLLDQYKDANGNFNVPPAQYAELAQGLAALVSGSNSLSDSRVSEIQQATAAGDIAKAIQYATGQVMTGSTQSILKNLSDSIDRQGQVAQQLRDQYVGRLQGLAPTGLNQDRVSALIQDQFPSYSEAMKGAYNVGGTQGGQNTTKSGKSFDYQGAIKAGFTDAQIQQYLASH